jgi:hypothetical protein
LADAACSLARTCGVEPLACERPQEHGRRQPVPHGVDGGDDDTVGLGVPQQAMALLAVATKRIIFLVQNLKRVGRDFTPPVPETLRMVDGRMVDGCADGRG